MKSMFLFTLLAFFVISIFITVPVEAQAGIEAESYSINFNIVENKAVVSEEMLFSYKQDKAFEVEVPEDAKSISIYSDGLPAEAVKEGSILIIQLNNTLELKLSYITKEILESFIDKKSFLKEVRMPFSAKELKIELVLPEQAVLYKKAEISVFPKLSEMTTDGQHIIIKWERQDLQEGESMSLFILFREKTPLISIFLLILAALLFIASFIIAIQRKPKVPEKKAIAKKTKRKINQKAEPELHLLDSEAAVINALKEAKGEMWQKQIQLKTGFSKAKLSRLIRNLEARGLIKRIPLGNTNKIKLK